MRQLLKKGHPQPCLSTQLCSAHVPRKAPLCPYLVHCDVWSIKLLRRICCTAMIGQGKSQPYWLKYDSRNSFIRVGSDSRNTVHTGRQFSAGSRPFSIGFSLKHSRSCLAMAFFFFFNLSPISHQESFSTGIFFVRVNIKTHWIFHFKGVIYIVYIVYLYKVV